MSYQNPDILTIVSPKGIDRAIQSIQQELDAGLPWLDKSFGRAWEFKEIDPATEKQIRVPKCYSGSGEYINVLPNDFLKAQSFISVRNEETWPAYSRATGNSKQRDLSVIFWFNLKEIDPAKDYIFTEELKTEVEKILKANAYVASINRYYDERVEDVFDGYISQAESGRYSVEDTKTQYLMYPYSGFRFDVTVAYMEEC
jgi:hypothetical protein